MMRSQVRSLLRFGRRLGVLLGSSVIMGGRRLSWARVSFPLSFSGSHYTKGYERLRSAT
jgi:hypothetical protein